MDIEDIKKLAAKLDNKLIEATATTQGFVVPDPKNVSTGIPDLLDTEPPPVEKRSSQDELFSRKLITELDTHYHLNEGTYPSLEYLEGKFKARDLREEILRIQPGLMGRGLPPYKFPEELDDPNQLDPDFVLACTLICNFSDKRSKEAKLKDIGLSGRQWSALLRQKKHRSYFNQRMAEVFDQDVKDNARLAIARGVEAGDLQAVKYFHEYSGEYRPQDLQVQNLQAIIMSMMEILAKYVKGEVLITIAEELDKKVNLTRMKELAS